MWEHLGCLARAFTISAIRMLGESQCAQDRRRGQEDHDSAFEDPKPQTLKPKPL